MSEHLSTSTNLLPVHTHEQGAVAYGALLESGISKAAQEYGFNVSEALKADGDRSLTPGFSDREASVLEAAQMIAAETGLTADFFDRPVNSVMLLAIADSWVATDRKINTATKYDPKIGDERAMLADVALIIGHNQSAAVSSLAESHPHEAGRYTETEHSTEKEQQLMSFYDSINDSERADKVAKLLKADGPNSFLGKQREALGLAADNEAPFDVKVLKMIDSVYDFYTSGTLKREIWPTDSELADTTPEGIAITRAKSEAAYNQMDENAACADEMTGNVKKYEEEFSVDFGPAPIAFVHTKNDAIPTLVIRANQADILINFSGEETTFTPDQKDDLDHQLAIVRHEYAHTQKKLNAGEHGQLGLLLEERKAELVSGDKNGYQDVKDFIKDISMSADTDILDLMDAALLKPDSLSAFSVAAANSIGLRDTLMLMIAKPLPYDASPERARQFANMKCLREAEDGSTLDSVVRETIERRGHEAIARRAGEWVTKLVERGITVEEGSVVDLLFNMRKARGLKVGTTYLAAAVSEQRKIDASK